MSVSSSKLNEQRSTAAAPSLATVQAVILAGGLGTRLRPVVEGTPKVMAEVAGRPFLDYLLGRLQRAGVREVVLCVGYGARKVEGHVRDGAGWGLEVRYSREQELLGTGGALKLAEAQLTDSACLVMNGDSFFDVPLARLVAHHRRAGAMVTIAATRVSDPDRYGSLDVGPDGRVRRFIEKGASGTGLINAGVYVIERAVLDGIPAGRAVSLERDVFPALTDGRLAAMPWEGYFVDIGLPTDYATVDARPERLLAALEDQA